MNPPQLPSAVHIGERVVGGGQPVYVIAEISANHHQSYDKALALIEAAAAAGADAVKLQTYTPESMTLDSDAPRVPRRAGDVMGGAAPVRPLPRGDDSMGMAIGAEGGGRGSWDAVLLDALRPRRRLTFSSGSGSLP